MTTAMLLGGLVVLLALGVYAITAQKVAMAATITARTTRAVDAAMNPAERR